MYTVYIPGQCALIQIIKCLCSLSDQKRKERRWQREKKSIKSLRRKKNYLKNVVREINGSKSNKKSSD